MTSLKQGLWRTVFGGNSRYSFNDMCAIAARLGIHGFDRILAKDWPILAKHGLRPLMVVAEELSRDYGIAHAQDHEYIEPPVCKAIDFCANNGGHVLNIFAGERKGISLNEAADNAVAFFRGIQHRLEKQNVTIVIENVNSRYPNPALGRADQVFEHWDWGVDVVRRVGSPNVKLICDLYHMQISDGDLERRVRESIDLIAHIHVAGVPTRGELDGPQEINYRHLAEIIADAGYTGYVSHEWRLSEGRDAIEAIRASVAILDV